MITRNFTLAEMSVTEVRHLQKLNREWAIENMAKLKLLCEFLEEVRRVLGVPMSVHSAIRHPWLNAYIGGDPNSQHMRAEATDFHPVGMKIAEAFDKIRKSRLQWGQLLLEDGDDDGVFSWIHISMGAPNRPPTKCQQVAIVRGKRYEWLHR